MLTARLLTFLTFVGIGVAVIVALAFLYAFLDYLWNHRHHPPGDPGHS
jgi:nitrate reductase NapE component